MELFYLKPGTILRERYAVGKVLGFGGFGIIYKAWDTTKNKTVAIKEYYPSGLVMRILGKSEIKLLSKSHAKEFNEAEKRFIKEAKNTAKFNEHPNIVSIIDHFQENNTVYYVMEHLGGVSLGEYLKKNKRLRVKSALQIILSICSAITAVHGSNTLHRDISPDNIIIPPDFPKGAVKLIDFGAARFSPDEIDTPERRIMRPGYSPPEQYILENQQNEQVDIYALGATLFYMLTGVEPEESTNRKIVDNIPVPKELNAEIPLYISNAILKAMAMDLHLRFKTVDEFVSALTGKKKVYAPKEEMKRREAKRRSSIIIVSATLLVGLSVLAFGSFKNWEATVLPDASVNMWYVITGDETVDASKTNALTSIIESFTDLYPNVNVSLQGIAQAQYEDKVSGVLDRQRFPVVLESTVLKRETLSRCLDVSSIAKKGSKGCYFLNRLSRYLPDKHQLPVGFNVAAIYINPELVEYENNGVENPSELFASMSTEVSLKGIALNEQYKNYFDAIFGSNTTTANRESYFYGETAAYFSNTAEFHEIQRLMPARYKLLYIDSEIVQAEFCGLWSLLPCEGAELEVCERLLQYLLGETAQDHLHISNRSGALPLNKATLETYKAIYSEFDGFLEKIDSYSFN